MTMTAKDIPIWTLSAVIGSLSALIMSPVVSFYDNFIAHRNSLFNTHNRLTLKDLAKSTLLFFIESIFNFFYLPIIFTRAFKESVFYIKQYENNDGQIVTKARRFSSIFSETGFKLAFDHTYLYYLTDGSTGRRIPRGLVQENKIQIPGDGNQLTTISTFQYGGEQYELSRSYQHNGGSYPNQPIACDKHGLRVTGTIVPDYCPLHGVFDTDVMEILYQSINDIPEFRRLTIEKLQQFKERPGKPLFRAKDTSVYPLSLKVESPSTSRGSSLE